MWYATAEKWFLRFLTIVLLGGLVIIYTRYVRSTGPVTPIGEIIHAPEIKHVEKKIRVPGPERIVYIEKEPLAERLKMPELKKERGDPTAVAEIPPHEGKTTAIAMLDNVTGETRLLMRAEPLPFFDLKKEMGLRAGAGSGGLIVGEVYLRPLAINPKDRGQLNVELRGFMRRTDAEGADFGGVVLLDCNF